MGAWSSGNFDNDGALDWLGGFLAGEDEGPIYATLEAALEEPDLELDVDAATAALAAAETVAAMMGRAVANAPGELLGWVRGLGDLGEVDPELRALAVEATRRVRERSEVRELWAEGGDASRDEWLAVVDDLLRRLQA